MSGRWGAMLVVAANVASMLFAPSRGRAEDAAKARLTIAGADEARTLKVQIVPADLDQTFRIDSMTPAPASQVEVVLTPLVGTKQRWVRPHWQCWSGTAPQPRCAKGEPCDTVDVAGLKEATCRVTAHLPEPDTYNGTLDLIYGGARETFKLVVIRGSDEELQIRGLDKEISIERATWTIKTGISSKGLRAVSKVTVIVRDLTGPVAGPVDVRATINGVVGSRATLTVPGNDEVSLELVAVLPVPGTYQGTIELVHDGRRDLVSFTVKRSDAKVPLVVRPIDAVRSDSSAATLRVILEGTRSDRFALDAPKIVALSRKDSDKVNSEASFSEVSSNSDDAKGGSGGEPSAGLTLDGRTPKELRVEIAGLSPGEYTGTLSVGATDLAPQEVPFTIYVRRTFWLAGALIAMGVLASWFLRRWATKGRARLMAQRQLAQKNAELVAVFDETADTTANEKEVLAALSKRVAKEYEKWERRAPDATPATTDSLIKEVVTKMAAFRRWVELRRRFEMIQSPSPEVAALQDSLANFKGRFLTEGPDDQLAAAIDKLSTDLATLLGGQLRANIEGMRREIKAMTGTATGKIYEDRLGAEVETRLGEATKKAASLDTLPEALALFNEARLAYFRVLAAALNRDVAAASPDPRYIPVAEWEVIVRTVREATERVRTAVDPDAALEAYAQGYTAYGTRLLQGLSLGLDVASEKLANSPLDADGQKAAKEKLAAGKLLAGACAADIANHEFTAAAKDLDQLRILVEEVTKTIEGVAMSPEERRELAVTNVIDGRTIRGYGVSPAAAESRSSQMTTIEVSIEMLDRRMRLNELIFTLAVGAVSVVLGVKLLWLPAVTWGDGADCITALLWGLGLHQVSGGIVAQFNWNTMLDKWSGTPSAQS